MSNVLPSVNRKQFEKNGWLLIENVFTPEEIEAMRAAIDEADKEFGGVHADLLTHKSLRGILTDERICHIAKQLADKPEYFGLSSFGANTTKVPHVMHHDAKGTNQDYEAKSDLDPSKAEWPIYRLGIFMQDHSKHSGGLKVRNKSHRNFIFRKHSLTQLAKSKSEGRWSLKGWPLGRLVDIPSKVGDVVAFNMRTHHAGRFHRLKMMPNVSLHPYIEHFLYKFLPNMLVPYERDRYFIFTTYATASDEMTNFIKNRVYAPANKDHWLQTDFGGKEQIAKLEKNGIAVNTMALDIVAKDFDEKKAA